MKTLNKKEITAIIMLIIPFILILIFWNKFPEKLPVNLNLSSENEFLVGRTIGLFLVPVMNIIFYLLFLLLPRIDIREDLKQVFSNSYHILRLSVTGFLLIVFLYIFLAGLSVF
jgi:uncharacterized membrane protein